MNPSAIVMENLDVTDMQKKKYIGNQIFNIHANFYRCRYVMEYKCKMYNIPFILMDIFTRLFAMSISYTNYRVYAPILFNICWIGFFVGTSLSFKKWIGKILYSLFLSLLEEQ